MQRVQLILCHSLQHRVLNPPNWHTDNVPLYILLNSPCTLQNFFCSQIRPSFAVIDPDGGLVLSSNFKNRLKGSIKFNYLSKGRACPPDLCMEGIFICTADHLPSCTNDNSEAPSIILTTIFWILETPPLLPCRFIWGKKTR